MEREVVGWCVVDLATERGDEYRYVRPSEDANSDGWTFGERYVWESEDAADSFRELAKVRGEWVLKVRRVVRAQSKLSPCYAARTLYAIAVRTEDGVEFCEDRFTAYPADVAELNDDEFVVRVTGWNRLTVEVVK